MKDHENILVYNTLYKSLIGSKSLDIRFDKINGFIRVYDATRYLVLFESEKYDSICNRIRYLISVKSGITYIVSHNYKKKTKNKVESYNSLPLEKAITFHNVVTHIKSVWNKGKNNYYSKIFLEKASYKNSFLYEIYVTIGIF